MEYRILWASWVVCMACGCVARSQAEFDERRASDRQVRETLAEWSDNFVFFPTTGLPSAETSVPTLVRIAESNSGATRLRAVWALAPFGATATEAVPVLCRFLHADDPQLRSVAAYALATIAPTTPGNAVAVLESLRADDCDSFVRTCLISVLNTTAAQWEDQLAQIVVDGPDRLRLSAFRKLYYLPPPIPGGVRTLADPAERILRDGLSSGRRDVRVFSAVLLSSRGFVFPNQLKLLVAGLRHPEPCVRLPAVRTLNEFHPEWRPELFEPLMKCLRDSDDVVVLHAARRLGEWGMHGEQVVPVLVEIVRRTDSFARGHAAYALVGFPQHAAQSIPCLVEALSEEYVRRLRHPHKEFKEYGHVWARDALRALSRAEGVNPEAKAKAVAALSAYHERVSPISRFLGETK